MFKKLFFLNFNCHRKRQSCLRHSDLHCMALFPLYIQLTSCFHPCPLVCMCDCQQDCARSTEQISMGQERTHSILAWIWTKGKIFFLFVFGGFFYGKKFMDLGEKRRIWSRIWWVTLIQLDRSQGDCCSFVEVWDLLRSFSSKDTYRRAKCICHGDLSVVHMSQ